MGRRCYRQRYHPAMGRVFKIKQPTYELSYEQAKKHKGKWGAFRDGRLIAAHRDPAKLLKKPEVLPGDTLVAIQDPDIKIHLYAAAL
jgi:hypothetical protein